MAEPPELIRGFLARIIYRQEYPFPGVWYNRDSTVLSPDSVTDDYVVRRTQVPWNLDFTRLFPTTLTTTR